VLCIVQGIIEMEQLQYLHSAGYYCNGAFTVLCIVQDIFEMEQLQYCA